MASKTLFLLKLIQKAAWFCFGKSVFLLTERYIILTWDTQCRLLEDRNGFSFLLHIPWIFICRPQEVSEALRVPMVYVSLTFSRVMARHRCLLEAGTGLNIHARLMRWGGHSQTQEVWEAHPTTWVIQGQFSLGLRGEGSFPKKQGQTRVRPARPLNT